MSWKGLREAREPSPPYRDPNPNKSKALNSLRSGKKIVKLTKIGESLRRKVQRSAIIDKSKEIVNNLDKKDYNILKNYIDNGHKINTELRFGGTNFSKEIISLDKSLSKIKTSTNIIVYKGMSKEYFSRFKKDDLWLDKGYVSTSIDKDKAEFFSKFFRTSTTEKRASYLIKIKLPKGTNFLYLGSVKGTPYSDDGYAPLKELLLPRNSKFKINTIKDNEAEAELL
ncbi:ADP-ribosyltransferase [Candidatus Pacearchaeota archaeon]|jgi:ribosomal protein S18|nr:ADP-ribosyltransferase [Candidatus Pacearchaeota archaeon]